MLAYAWLHRWVTKCKTDTAGVIVMSTVRSHTDEARPPRIATTAGEVGLGAAAGAAVEYLFDPDRGRSRRAKVRDKLASGTHRSRTGLETLTRDMAARSGGVVAAARYRVAGRHADDQVLHDRVRETLGRHVSHSHAVHVEVSDGVAVLTGDVLAGEDGPACRAIKRVPGIKDVDARWSVHSDPTGVLMLQGGSPPRGSVPELLQQNWSPTARFMAGTGGFAACALAGRFPAPVAWALRGTGATFVVRAVSNMPFKRLTGIGAGRQAVKIIDGVSVAAPPEQVWSLISDYSIFRRVMPDVRDIRRDADGITSHWEIAGPAGVPVRFQAEETSRVEGHEITWKTTDGQLIAHTGKIRVDPEPDIGSRIQVELGYNPVAGAIGHAFAKLFGADPKHKLDGDLQRLKSYIETGKQPGDAVG
jgi:uncharacterized membrane protein